MCRQSYIYIVYQSEKHKYEFDSPNLFINACQSKIFIWVCNELQKRRNELHVLMENQ